MKYRIVAAEKYKKDGVEKISWKEVGSMFESKTGKLYLKLNILPNQIFNVFEDKPRDNLKMQGVVQGGYMDNHDDVPF